MPQDMAERFHQQAEIREVMPKHGRGFNLADEAHERDARARERITAALNLERGHIGEMTVTARIVGATHDQRLVSRVLKGDFKSADSGTPSALVALDDVRPDAVAKLGQNLQNTLPGNTVAVGT